MYIPPGTKLTAIGILIVFAISATIAYEADTPSVSKSAAVLCFALLAVLFFVLPGKGAVDAVDSYDDDNDDSGRQSLSTRLAWAGWMSLSAVACFGMAQLAGALLPPLAVPLRVIGVIVLVVAAYKLFLGRRGKNNDIDL